MPRYIKRRKQGFYENITIPAVLRPRYGGRAKLEGSLQTSDEKVALIKAQLRASELRLEALEAQQGRPNKTAPTTTRADLREAYRLAREKVLAGELRVRHFDGGEEVGLDPVLAGVDEELDTIRERQWSRADRNDPDAEPIGEPLEEARADGLEDGRRLYLGKKPKHEKAYDAPFRETALQWLEEWKRNPERKAANTGGQYLATIEAFAEWWGEKPLRAVTPRDAAAYASYLTGVTPGAARHRKRASQPASGNTAGLTASTIRRHVATLGQIWKWARPRLGLAGDNPWKAEGVAPRKPKRPTREHLPWTVRELGRLLVENRPSRRDVYEACLVALYSGMRASEVANMTWGRLVQEEGVWCFRVDDAKTPAGVRRVPVHQALSWMLEKPRMEAGSPIWPDFNPEGPGKSRGDDLSRLFGAYKRRLGFGTGKTFHGFRKTITNAAEQLGISMNIWGRLLGHEPGFTYGVYNPHGLTPAAAKEWIDRISYGDLRLPQPAEVYPETAQGSEEATPARPSRGQAAR